MALSSLGLVTMKLRSRCNPSGAKANHLRLEAATGWVSSELTCEKFKHRAERRACDETFTLMPSLLQGSTSIDTVSW